MPIREKFKGEQLYRRGKLEKGSRKLDLAVRFMGGPPKNMKEFAKFTETIFGTPLHLKSMYVGDSYAKDDSTKNPHIKFCTLERADDFLNNPYIKKWKENYGIDWLTLCELSMEKVFGGPILEMHVKNYVSGKAMIDLHNEKTLQRLKSMYDDWNSPSYQSLLIKHEKHT